MCVVKVKRKKRRNRYAVFTNGFHMHLLIHRPIHLPTHPYPLQSQPCFVSEGQVSPPRLMISSQVLRPDPTSHVSGHRVAVVVGNAIAVEAVGINSTAMMKSICILADGNNSGTRLLRTGAGIVDIMSGGGIEVHILNDETRTCKNGNSVATKKVSIVLIGERGRR